MSSRQGKTMHWSIRSNNQMNEKHGKHDLSAQIKRNDDVGNERLPNSCFYISCYFWWTPYTDSFDMVLARPEPQILAAPTRVRLLESIFRNHKNWNYLGFWHLSYLTVNKHFNWSFNPFYCSNLVSWQCEPHNNLSKPNWCNQGSALAVPWYSQQNNYLV